MAEREHGTERPVGDEAVAHPAGFEPAADREQAAPSAQRARLAPRPDQGLSFAEALDETMREHGGSLRTLDDDREYRRQMAIGRGVLRRHRAALAALAESERQDREAETGAANIARGLAG